MVPVPVLASGFSSPETWVAFPDPDFSPGPTPAAVDIWGSEPAEGNSLSLALSLSQWVLTLNLYLQIKK